MVPEERSLSVSEAAALCNVGRSTINYWIKAKKIYANRSGRNYAIPVSELGRWLTCKGRDLPPLCKQDNLLAPVFKMRLPCWEYWKGNPHRKGCEECVVVKHQLVACFTAREDYRVHCDTDCVACRYYREIYLPKIQFIHQIGFPAALYKGLHVWGMNAGFAELCGIPPEEALGMGVENLFHEDSLRVVISNIKKRALGNPEAPRRYPVYLKSNRHGRIGLDISVYPLREPPGAHLIIGEQEGERATPHPIGGYGHRESPTWGQQSGRGEEPPEKEE
ncbi:MAG: helix-turn-helix domain-containing protein [Deltaproteobacteria bacterium]|nr:helix-turn-helix domain-containing protein [Deltaproteobacteria bacterium]